MNRVPSSARARSCSALLLCAASGAFGLTLTGTVVDYGTGLPVSGATAVVAGRADIAAAFTDAQGVFVLPPLPMSRFNPANRRQSLQAAVPVRTFDIRGRRVCAAQAAGICITMLPGLSTHAVVLNSRTVKPGVQNRSVSPGVTALSKSAASGDSSGQVWISKAGYFPAAVPYMRPDDTVMPVRLVAQLPLPTCGSVMSDSAGYAVAGPDTLSLLWPFTIDSLRYCDAADQHAVFHDSLSADTASHPFALSGDSLELAGDTAAPRYLYADSGLAPYAVLAEFTRWTRVGTGAGFEGTWHLCGRGYHIVSGAVSDSMKAVLDIEYGMAAAQDVVRQTCMILGGGTAQTYFSAEGARRVRADDVYATYFILARASGFDGSVRREDDSTALIAGSVTHDTVAITVDLSGNVRFHCRSGNPAYTDHTWHADNPPACPNLRRPSWMDDFLWANRLPGLGKRGMIAAAGAADAGAPVKKRILR